MTKRTRFDPYHKWLGIPADQQPASHYRLLRIEPFESDAAVIENAYNKEMADLKRQEHGDYAEFVDPLSRELIVARDCLLDADAKAEYDAQLRRETTEIEQARQEAEQLADQQAVQRAVQRATAESTVELRQLRQTAEQAELRQRQAQTVVQQLHINLQQARARQIPARPPARPRPAPQTLSAASPQAAQTSPAMPASPAVPAPPARSNTVAVRITIVALCATAVVVIFIVLAIFALLRNRDPAPVAVESPEQVVEKQPAELPNQTPALPDNFPPDDATQTAPAPPANESSVKAAHTRAVMCLDRSPDGSRLVSGSDDATIKLWDADAKRVLKTYSGHQGGVSAVRFSPDGQRLLSGGRDGTCRLWDVASGDQIYSRKAHAQMVTAVAFDPAGQHVATASIDRTIKVWDAQAGNRVWAQAGHSGPVLGIDYGRYGKRLASASQDRSVRIWDADTGKQLNSLAGHTYDVLCVAFSPDDKLIVSGSRDKTIRVWDARTGAPVRALTGHANGVTDLAFSADGRRLASAGEDYAVRIWDVETGRPISTFTGHTRVVRSVVFSGDGNRCFSGSDDGTLRTWDIASNPATAATAPTRRPPDSGLNKSVARDQLVAWFDSQQGNWFALPYAATLPAGERVLVMPTFSGQFILRSGIRMIVRGPGLFQIEEDSGSSRVNLRVHYGNLHIMSMRQDLQVGLRFGDRRGVATLGKTGSACILQMMPYCPPGIDPAVTQSHLVSQLNARQGSLLWEEAGDPVNVQQGRVLTLVDDHPATLVPALLPPTRMSASFGTSSTTARRKLLSLAGESRPLTETLLSAVDDADVAVKSLAARCLSHLQHFEPSVAALRDPSNNRQQLPTGLIDMRQALARGPDSAKQLQRAMEKEYGGDGQQLYRMLWGYTPEQLAGGLGNKLADYLDHDDIEFRVLAFQNLSQMMRASLGYSPFMPERVRAAAVQRWRQHLAARRPVNPPSDPLQALVSAVVGQGAAAPGGPGVPPPAVAPPPATEPAAAVPEVAAVESITLLTKDKVQLRCNFYEGPQDRSTVPIILVHAWNGNRGDFETFATHLQQRGHSVIVPDLRGHGASKVFGSGVEADVSRIDASVVVAMDMEAVKTFLLEKNNAGELNIDLLCVIGAEEGALIALNWTLFDWSKPQLVARRQGRDVKAIALLSPPQSFQRLSWTQAIRSRTALQTFPMLVMAGDRDTDGLRDAKRLQSALRSDAFQLVSLDTAARGSELLDPGRKLDAAERIDAFIQQQIVARRRQFPWTAR